MGHTFHTENELQVLISPADQASTNSAWVAPFATGYRSDRAVFILSVGVVATDTVAMSIKQATDSSGTGSKAITGASITTITGSTDNVVVTIDVAPGALDDANGFKYMRAEVVVSGSGSEPFGLLLNKYRLRHAGIAAALDDSYSEQVVVP
jgi:hypothetical protein